MASRAQRLAAVQLTARDRELLDWLSWTRLADTNSVQTMLGALGSGPVSHHVAVRRIAKLRAAGLVGTGRVHHESAQVVWPTHEAAGRAPQSPYSATSVHALTTSAVTAQLRVSAVVSREDQAPHAERHRVADAVLEWPGGHVELLEVELTPKAPERLRAKLRDMRRRWAADDAVGTLYVATPPAARAVQRIADAALPPDVRPRLRVVDVDEVTSGRWAAEPPLVLPREGGSTEADGWSFS